MTEGRNVWGGKVPVRTIIAAICMLAGIILMGYGYFEKDQVFFYVGAALTVSGVMIQALLAIMPGSQGGRKRRGR